MGFAKESFADFDYSIQILTKDVTYINLSSNAELTITKDYYEIK
jgi:hypothetical protein